MKMFLITYHGKPLPNTDDAKKLGGAYINCYIEADKFEEANLIARGEIEKNHWNILELDDTRVVTKDDYIDDPHNREYFEQALIDKEVLVFHTYPIEDERE